MQHKDKTWSNLIGFFSDEKHIENTIKLQPIQIKRLDYTMIEVDE